MDHIFKPSKELILMVKYKILRETIFGKMFRGLILDPLFNDFPGFNAGPPEKAKPWLTNRIGWHTANLAHKIKYGTELRHLFIEHRKFIDPYFLDFGRKYYADLEDNFYDLLAEEMYEWGLTNPPKNPDGFRYITREDRMYMVVDNLFKKEKSTGKLAKVVSLEDYLKRRA